MKGKKMPPEMLNKMAAAKSKKAMPTDKAIPSKGMKKKK